MAPVKISLPSHYKGDSWIGMNIGPVLINGAQPANTLSSCRMQFRDVDDILGQEFNTVYSGVIAPINILNATTWLIDVPAYVIDLDAGKWYWDFEITDSLGTVITLYKGTLNVKEDVTE